MATTTAVTNQQALVQSILSKRTVKPVRHVIPGGKALFTSDVQMNLADLENAIFTWLRRVTTFSDCSIEFTNSLSKYNTKVTKTVDFPDNLTPIWEQAKAGKRYLAAALAEQISKGGMLAIEVKKDGIYVVSDKGTADFSPSSVDWEPAIVFTKVRRAQYAVY